MSKKCPFCGSIRIVENLKGGTSICLACESFFNKIDGKSKQTIFDRIAASPEVLAEKLVYRTGTSNSAGLKMFGYRSTIVSGFWVEKVGAIAATVAKLKEVKK